MEASILDQARDVVERTLNHIEVVAESRLPNGRPICTCDICRGERRLKQEQRGAMLMVPEAGSDMEAAIRFLGRAL